jgi:hypothetical protein
MGNVRRPEEVNEKNNQQKNEKRRLNLYRNLFHEIMDTREEGKEDDM